MLAKDLPLLFAGCARLAENFRRHGELADVMQQGTPTKPVQILIGKAELLTDQVRVCTYTFGVAPG